MERKQTELGNNAVVMVTLVVSALSPGYNSSSIAARWLQFGKESWLKAET